MHNLFCIIYEISLNTGLIKVLIIMQEIRQIGKVNWTNDEIRESIPEFLELYKRKPVNDNQGGMKSPHMFATWFMLKKIKPANVIESGIWKGQGTWLIENTLPKAKVFSIDIYLDFREYKSDKVAYFDKDFSLTDWSFIENKEDTLLFFDDHQNAMERIKLGNKLGFKKFIFEDNYPQKQGNCYSLKKAFQHTGFNTSEDDTRASDYLKSILEIYYEFPPVFKKKFTRWLDLWNDNDYPTPIPLYTQIEENYLKIFEQEAIDYTWICFAKIK